MQDNATRLESRPVSSSQVQDMSRRELQGLHVLSETGLLKENNIPGRKFIGNVINQNIPVFVGNPTNIPGNDMQFGAGGV